MTLTRLPAWSALAAHRRELADTELRTLFTNDARRFEKFSIQAAGLFLDYSKNRIVEATLPLLVKLADEAQVPAKMAAMFTGERVNHTEQRAVLHTALRNQSQNAVRVNGTDVMPDVRRVL